MNLYPQDLREDYHWQVVVLRDSYPVKTPEQKAIVLGQPRTKRPLGFLGKLWVGRLPLNHQQAQVTMSSLSMVNPFMAWGGYLFFLCLVGMLTVVMPYLTGKTTALQALAIAAVLNVISFHFFLINSPRGTLKDFYRPLNLPEVEGLVTENQTELERAYLTLVRNTVLQPVPEEAEGDVRAAVASIGEAMDALPLIDPIQTDTALLRGETAALRAQATSEPDIVVADSLSHQADAVLRRADAADSSAQYARRIAALRREIAAQIAAVQEDLSTYSATGGAAVDRIALSHLADGARRVATILVSAANARAELDSFSSPLRRQPPLTADELPVRNLQVTIK